MRYQLTLSRDARTRDSMDVARRHNVAKVRRAARLDRKRLDREND